MRCTWGGFQTVNWERDSSWMALWHCGGKWYRWCYDLYFTDGETETPRGDVSRAARELLWALGTFSFMDPFLHRCAYMYTYTCMYTYVLMHICMYICVCIIIFYNCIGIKANTLILYTETLSLIKYSGPEVLCLLHLVEYHPGHRLFSSSGSSGAALRTPGSSWNGWAVLFSPGVALASP